MKRALEQQDLASEAASLREQTRELRALLKKAEAQLAPVFKNRRMVEMEDFISQIAPSEANVLVTGESGVGKEVVANLVHARSRRAGGPLVKLNCAALPQHLIEGELFGYVKGAFTGAVNDFPGHDRRRGGRHAVPGRDRGDARDACRRGFCACCRSASFVRWAAPRRSRRISGSSPRPTRTSPARSARACLRPDLYYRINTFQIEIPPLRDRREDVPPLVALFIKRYAQQMGRPEPQITTEAMARLRDFSWPGNVRQLQNAVEYAVVLAKADRITEESLPPELLLPPEVQEHLIARDRGGSRRSRATATPAPERPAEAEPEPGRPRAATPSSRRWRRPTATSSKPPKFSGFTVRRFTIR